MLFQKFIAFHLINSQVLYSGSTSSAIHDLIADNNYGVYYLGSEDNSGDNVVVGHIDKNYSPQWQVVYPGNKVYSFTSDSDKNNLFFTLVSSSVQYILKLNAANGAVSASISSSLSAWNGAGWRVLYNWGSLYISAYKKKKISVFAC